MFNDLFLAANHHAVTALKTPHTAAGAYVNVVNLARRELFRPLDIVDVIGIPTVDENVAWFEMRQEIGDGLLSISTNTRSFGKTQLHVRSMILPDSRVGYDLRVLICPQKRRKRVSPELVG